MPYEFIAAINEDGFFEGAIAPIHPNNSVVDEALLNDAIAQFCAQNNVPVFKVSGGDRYYFASTANPQQLLIELAIKLTDTAFLFDDRSPDPENRIAIAPVISAAVFDPFRKELVKVQSESSKKRQGIYQRLNEVDKSSEEYQWLMLELDALVEANEPDEIEQEQTVPGLKEIWRSA